MRNKKRNDRMVSSKIDSIVNSIPNNPFPYMSYEDKPVEQNEISQEEIKDS